MKRAKRANPLVIIQSALELNTDMPNLSRIIDYIEECRGRECWLEPSDSTSQGGVINRASTSKDAKEIFKYW